MSRTAEQLVQAEVFYCVSSLVSTLAAGYGAIERPNQWSDLTSLSDLTEQAFELASPIADYEEAAREAIRQFPGRFLDAESATDWPAFCDLHDIEPYDREVYEHWIVSNWLADKLEAKGEKVDRDFAGMIVWARTTTGQAIHMDSVIEAIRADLVREYGEA